MKTAPLLWPGGKSKIVHALKPHFGEVSCLVEPFVGSAAVFLNTDYPSYILSDINKDLIVFYETVAENPHDLLACSEPLFANGNNLDTYLETKDKFNARTEDRVVQSAMFMYLNRHGFNGLCRYNRKNEINVPFGRRTKPLYPKAAVLEMHNKIRRTDTRFLCGPFDSILTEQTFPQGSTIYCDPPYVPWNPTSNFTNYESKGFNYREHEQLMSCMLQLSNGGHKVIVSGSDTVGTREVYKGMEFEVIQVQRSIGAKSREKVREVIGFFPK